METLSKKQRVALSDGAEMVVTVHSMSGRAPDRDIVLLHGWPNSGRVWEPLQSELLPAAAPDISLRFVIPDLRGFGESSTITSGFTCEQFALDVLTVANKLGLRNYLLVGHSMSGKIAQLVAAKQPAELAALALISPTTLAAAGIPPEKIAAQKAARSEEAKVAETVLRMLARPVDDTTRTMLIGDGLQAAPQAWDGWLETMREEEFSVEAAKIAVPTLVVAPEADPLRTPETVKANVADKIKGAIFATIPRSGHLPHIEDPITLAALLVNFMDGLPKDIGE